MWALLRDFGDDSWTGVPIDVEGQGVGAVRTVAMPFGPVVERCDAIDDDARALTYAVIGGDPGPCRDFAATLKNLFNEHYFSYGVFTGFPTYAALPAPERSLFVSAQYTFR